MSTSCTATLRSPGRARSLPCATARHWPRWYGATIFAAYSFIRSAPRRSARASCATSSRCEAARMLLIPSIDLLGGHCVRLLKGDFDAQTRYPLEAHELLQRYQRLGASWLHVVDLDGARDGTLINRDVIYRLATQRAVRLQVGGGVRDTAVLEDLLNHGVARVVIGSAAVEQPQMVAGWLERYGSE